MGEGALPSAGDFRGETYCGCGFMLDEYEAGPYRVEYVDPDTGRVIPRCPGCGISLLGTRFPVR